MKPKNLNLKIYTIRKITKESLQELMKENPKATKVYLHQQDFYRLDSNYILFKDNTIILKIWDYLEPNQVTCL